MSQTETNIGKLIPVKLSEGETIEDAAKRLVTEKLRYKTYLEQLLSDNYDEYYEYQGVLYRVENQTDEGGDVFQANLMPDGSINYVLTYYNGGCCWSEAMDHALDKLAKKQALTP